MESEAWPRKGNPHAQVQVHRVAKLSAFSRSSRPALRPRPSVASAAYQGKRLLNWRAKYGGLEVSDLRRLKELEDENRRLKKIVADQALNIEALKMVAEENCKARTAQEPAVRAVQERWEVSERGACRWLDVNRKLYLMRRGAQPMSHYAVG